MTPEVALPSAGVTAPPESGANQATDSPSVSQGTSAPTEQSAGPVNADVQGQTPEVDPFADLPSVDELKQQAEQGVKYAAALANLRGVIDPLRTQNTELQAKFSPFEQHLSRFEQPEQLQELLELQDGLIGWDNDPKTGEPIPFTEKAAGMLHERYPGHAIDLMERLGEQEVFDTVTGRSMSAFDLAIHAKAENPAEKARLGQILGLVEPSAVAPQWAPTEEELANVKPELQDVYRKLPYEEREELKLNSPDFINRVLEKEKLQQELVTQREQAQQREQQEAQQREQRVNQQATQAGTTYLNEQLNSALSTFHEEVVRQCNFLQPIDTANLPQGMTPEQAAQLNQQVAQSNKAEAAQITGTVIGLLNPQVRPYIEPFLREIGIVDDKLLAQLDQAATNFGNNARNYGNLTFRQKLAANGNYQPDASVTNFSNEAGRGLKALVGIANNIRAKLIEQRSQFFTLKATEHNQTLNGAQGVRPPINGQAYNPTTAPAQQPQGWMSRADMQRQFG